MPYGHKAQDMLYSHEQGHNPHLGLLNLPPWPYPKLQVIKLLPEACTANSFIIGRSVAGCLITCARTNKRIQKLGIRENRDLAEKMLQRCKNEPSGNNKMTSCNF